MPPAWIRASIRSGCCRLVPADLGQVAARHGKGHVDRCDLIDHDERRRVVRTHQIPLVDVQGARATGNRGEDMCVLEVQAGVFNLRLIGGQGRLERQGIRGLGLVLVAGDEPAVEEVLVPRALRLGILRLCRIPGEHGLRLLERGLEGARVEREERGPGLDVLALREVNRAQLAGDLRPYLDRGQRFGRADGRNRDRNGLRHDQRGDDWNGPAATAGATASARPEASPAAC